MYHRLPRGVRFLVGDLVTSAFVHLSLRNDGLGSLELRREFLSSLFDALLEFEA